MANCQGRGIRAISKRLCNWPSGKTGSALSCRGYARQQPRELLRHQNPVRSRRHPRFVREVVTPSAWLDYSRPRIAWHEGCSTFVIIALGDPDGRPRSEEHTSELQSLMRISYAVFCLKKKNITYTTHLPKISIH